MRTNSDSQEEPGPGHMEDSRLLDRLEGRLSPSDAAAVDRHVDGCARCRKRREELAGVVCPLTSRVIETAPERLRNWSEDLPRSHPRRTARPVVRILRPAFDSWALQAAGARSANSGVRRFVFRSGPVDLDVQLETSPGSKTMKIRGQVLDGSIPGGRRFTAGEVGIRSGRREVARSILEERGEFVLQNVEPGTYDLWIRARGVSCRARLEV